MGTVALALSLLAVALPCLAATTLRIGAFNIQTFGDTKMANEGVASIIVSVSAASAMWGRAVHWGGPKARVPCQGDVAVDGMASQCWG